MIQPIQYPYSAMQNITRHKNNKNNNYNSHSQQEGNSHKHNHSYNSNNDFTGFVVASSLFVATILVFVIYCYDRYVKFKNIRKQI